jgi:hypothetical protein
MSDVTELIAALRAGTLSLGQVAQFFRERDWPDARDPDLAAQGELVSSALDDPGPYLPGSFDDVSAALHRHELTLHQYEVLAQAAAESINAGGRQRTSS